MVNTKNNPGYNLANPYKIVITKYFYKSIIRFLTNNFITDIQPAKII